MSFASSLLAYTPLKNPGMSDALPYLTGFLVVVITLGVLLTLCVIVSKVLQQVTPEPVSPKQIVKSAAATPADDDIPADVMAIIVAAAAASVNDSVPTEIVAVIAAATATVIGQSHRVVSIKPHNTTWSQAGRQQLHSSHNIR